MGGPDVLSLAAGEARDPRKVMPFAFKSVSERPTCLPFCVRLELPPIGYAQASWGIYADFRAL